MSITYFIYFILLEKQIIDVRHFFSKAGPASQPKRSLKANGSVVHFPALL